MQRKWNQKWNQQWNQKWNQKWNHKWNHKWNQNWNKKCMVLALAVFTMGALAGCGKETANLPELKTEKYVELGEYTGLSASAPAAEVSQETLDSYINYVLRTQAEPVEVTDRAVQNGDTVNIDYEGKLDGVAFEGGTAQGYDLIIGSGNFIAGFEDGLIGAENGETLDLNLTFPDPYQNAELAGKEVVFTVKVNAIKGVPELTDELAATLDEECSNVAEYEQKVLDALTQDAKAGFDQEIESALMEQMSANANFKKDPPEEMVQQYLNRIRTNLEAAAKYYGMTFDDMLSMQGMTADTFEEQARPGAVEAAKESIMIQAIANKEGLNPSEEEIAQRMEEEAEKGGFESVEAFKETINEINYRDYAMMRNVLDFVKENSTIEETKAE